MAKPKHYSSAETAAPASTGASYTVLARRYRPQQFGDLVGQEAVVQALVNALESNRVAHAYLFTGARGVGKTSTARILAKALNCVHGPTTAPCDRCDICQSIAVGEDVDVVEIDGASNNRIDEVREIRQNAQYRPSKARYKIYIIDEVHMLTAQAFNALLKTLEEPPEHVKFIFATTEVQKIPITILSRCQRFDFAGIATGRIVERLRQVVAGEGMRAEDDALELIARRAGGSMRDAQSLLDQLLGFGRDRLTTDHVHKLLGTAHDERVLALASAVLDHDPGRALALLAQAADEGLQLGEFLDQLIEYWRDLMLAHCAGSQFEHVNLPARHRELLGKQAAVLELDTILAGLDILSAAKARMRGSSHPRILLEMALVRLGRLDDLVSLSQLAQLIGQAAGHAGNSAGLPTSFSATAARSAPPLQPEDARQPSDSLKKKLDSPLEVAAASTPKLIALTPKTLAQVWPAVLSKVGRFLATELEGAGLPAILGPNTLVLHFPRSYNAHREHCQEPSSLRKVEDALRRVTGEAWSVRIDTLDSAPVATGEKSGDEAESQSRLRRQQAEAMKEPLIKRAFEVLGAQFVGAPEDGFGSSAPATLERPEPPDSEEA
jgi:DNA polymerase-3 subunit gamma/tau